MGVGGLGNPNDGVGILLGVLKLAVTLRKLKAVAHFVSPTHVSRPLESHGRAFGFVDNEYVATCRKPRDVGGCSTKDANVLGRHREILKGHRKLWHVGGAFKREQDIAVARINGLRRRKVLGDERRNVKGHHVVGRGNLDLVFVGTAVG